MGHADLAALEEAREGGNAMNVAHVVSQADIDLYAQVSGDFNPLHVDAEFAATSPFGRTIAHGMMTMALLMNQVEVEHGSIRMACGGDVSVRFREPIFAGDMVEVVTQDDERSPGVTTVEVEARVGDRVCAAGSVELGLT